MRKLLFSVSVVLLIASCSNQDAIDSKKDQNTTDAERPSMKEQAPIERTAPEPESVQDDQPQAKPVEEPRHDAPNQSSIDSIKAAKQKGKK